jgi:hypothetical protein
MMMMPIAGGDIAGMPMMIAMTMAAPQPAAGTALSVAGVSPGSGCPAASYLKMDAFGSDLNMRRQTIGASY